MRNQYAFLTGAATPPPIPQAHRRIHRCGDIDRFEEAQKAERAAQRAALEAAKGPKLSPRQMKVAEERRQILDLVTTSTTPPRTEAIAEKIGIDLRIARAHLTNMQAEGMVHGEWARRGLGRSKVWTPADSEGGETDAPAASREKHS
jgi:hypothetical protein